MWVECYLKMARDDDTLMSYMILSSRMCATFMNTTLLTCRSSRLASRIRHSTYFHLERTKSTSPTFTTFMNMTLLTRRTSRLASQIGQSQAYGHQHHHHQQTFQLLLSGSHLVDISRLTVFTSGQCHTYFFIIWL